MNTDKYSTLLLVLWCRKTWNNENDTSLKLLCSAMCYGFVENMQGGMNHLLRCVGNMRKARDGIIMITRKGEQRAEERTAAASSHGFIIMTCLH